MAPIHHHFEKKGGLVNNSNSFLDYRNNTGSCRISYIKIKVVNDFKINLKDSSFLVYA